MIGQQILGNRHVHLVKDLLQSGLHFYSTAHGHVNRIWYYKINFMRAYYYIIEQFPLINYVTKLPHIISIIEPSP